MAYWFLINLGLFALSLYAARKLYTPPSVTAPRPQGVTLPTVQLGTPIPLVYGTWRLRAPIATAMGRSDSVPIVESGTTIGYAYLVGLRMLLCHSNTEPGDTGGEAEMIAFFAGGDRVHSGILPDWLESYNGARTYQVGAEAGEHLEVGAAQLGQMHFYGGSWTQGLHNGDRLRDASGNLETTATMPRYRGQVYVSLPSWHIGMNTTIPPYSWAVHNPVRIPGHEAASGPIGVGDANPIAVVYNLLTRGWGGVGLSSSAIDADNFAAVAQALQDEEHGISIAFEAATTARAAIEMILRQVDGVMYEDPSTRRLALKLIRDDYDVGDLEVLDASNLAAPPELTGTLWTGTYNEVQVTWTDPEAGYRSAVYTAIDEANIYTQGARRVHRLDFPGISRQSLAAWVATRELNFLARPLRTVTLEVGRVAATLRPGDPFVLDWPEAGIDAAVFRVVRPEEGELANGRVRLTAVEDRFAITHALSEQPIDVYPIAPPDPVEHRVISEAPRWIQQRAYDLGQIANVDAQRGYYLAAEPASGTRYRVDTDGAADAPARTFPTTFRVAADYARTSGPYDTTVGLEIDSVNGTVPESLSASVVAAGGNLVQIGDELLAFETVTALGGGAYTLGNVWRGVLDTSPHDHLEGAIGYVLPGVAGASALGARIHEHGATVEARTYTSTASGWTSEADSPADEIEIRSRVRLPYPPDRLLLNGSQTPATLGLDEGVAVGFRQRDRLAGAIVRPDAASETPEAGTGYLLVGRKDGGEMVSLAAGVTGTASTVYHLGALGHGEPVEVGATGILAVTLPSGTTSQLTSWDPPYLEIDAPHHRNLIVNGTFADGANGWTVTVGTATTATAGLGGGGSYLTAATNQATVTLRQDVPVSGYPAGSLRALLSLAAFPIADTTDTVAVTLTSRDASGVILDTSTLSATTVSAAARHEVEIAELDPDTATIRVEITIAAVGELDTQASVGVTEVILEVGQFTDQLLANPSFEDKVTDWTETVGTWQQVSVGGYVGDFLQPDDVASAQLRQSVTPAAGWETHATAVLWFARKNLAADDTGEVTLAALSGGGTVLASSSTSDEEIDTSAGWVRRRLALDLPAGTATVRVQLDATRAAGTSLDSAFDDFRLRIHKDLDAAYDLDRSFAAIPTQRLPRTPAEWRAAFGCSAPNVAIYAGSLAGQLGTEPLLETVGTAYAGGTIVCPGYVATEGAVRTDCYDLAGGSIRVAPVGNDFLNLSSLTDWAVGIVYRSSEETWPGQAVKLIGRTDGTVGWSIGLTSDGRPTAQIVGASGDDSAIGGEGGSSTGPGFGVLRMAILHFDASADLATLIDASGSTTIDTSALGEWATPAGTQAAAGTGGDGDFVGQIARIYAWRGSVTPTASELAAAIQYATNPTNVAEPTARTGIVASVVGSDTEGHALALWPIERVPFVDDEEAGPGLLAMPAGGNLAVSTWSGWATVAGTVTDGLADATGMRIGCSVAGTSSQGRRSGALSLGSAGTRTIAVVYRAPNGAASVVVEDNAGTAVATQTLPQSSTWTVHTFAVSWSGATSGVGRLRLCGSSTGTARTAYYSPIVYAAGSTTPPHPRAIPLGAVGAVAPRLTASTLTSRYNVDGELLVSGVAHSVGTLARVWNGSTTGDEREVRYSSGGYVDGRHADSAGSANTASLSPVSVDTSTAYTARLRWARVGLADGVASTYSAIRAEQGSIAETEQGRTSTWTPGSGALDRVDLGHSAGNNVAAATITRVRLRAREPRL